MRARGVLTIVLVASVLTGCGDRGTRSDRDQSGLTGQVHLGPQCPVERQGHRCDDRPAAGTTVQISKPKPGNPEAAGLPVARTTTSADGSYRVAVAPGRYRVTATAGMSCTQINIRVIAAQYATVDIRCDTGIR